MWSWGGCYDAFHMNKKQLIKLIFTLWFLNTLILILVFLTPLELNPYRIIYWQSGITIIGLPFLNWLKKRTHSAGILTIFVTIISIVGIGYFSTFLDWRGPWRTQTVKYRNLHLANRTIEFQMQDKGAFGYNRRTVDVIRLLPFLRWTTEASISELDSLTWKLVDEDVNELGLKAP